MTAFKVIGLGNVLVGDDAFGPHVTKLLEAAYEFPEDASVVDLGTPGLDLVPYLSDADILIVVDTVQVAGRPGELRVFDHREIRPLSRGPRLGPHEPGLEQALTALQLSGGGPREVLLVGVVPERTCTGIGLSPAVRAAVPAAVLRVVHELQCRGARLRPRPWPSAPDIWWEESGGSSACTK